jgi:hypothetical protein
VLVLASAPWIHAALPDEFFWTAISLASAGIVAAYVFALLDRMRLLGSNHRWARLLGPLPRHLAQILFSLRWLGSVAALAVASHVISMAAAYAISIAVGADIRLVDLLAVFPWVILATALPISIAGWGVREGAMIWGLSLVGGRSGEALALSLLYGIVTIVAALPGVLFWLAPKPALRH